MFASDYYLFTSLKFVMSSPPASSRRGFQKAPKRKGENQGRSRLGWGRPLIKDSGRKHGHGHKGPLDMHLTAQHDKEWSGKPGRWSLFDPETWMPLRIVKTELADIQKMN